MSYYDRDLIIKSRSDRRLTTSPNYRRLFRLTSRQLICALSSSIVRLIVPHQQSCLVVVTMRLAWHDLDSRALELAFFPWHLHERARIVTSKRVATRCANLRQLHTTQAAAVARLACRRRHNPTTTTRIVEGELSANVCASRTGGRASGRADGGRASDQAHDSRHHVPRTTTTTLVYHV